MSTKIYSTTNHLMADILESKEQQEDTWSQLFQDVMEAIEETDAQVTISWKLNDNEQPCEPDR